MAELYEAEAEEAPDRSFSDDRLMAAIEEREGTALGRETDPVSVDRATAISYYLGQPFGNEIEGRSQVVSKDVFDTIEWIKPSLLRIFAGGDQIAEFQPESEEDIQGAEQESDYINYVIQRKNNWFALANTWFTDALLTRNAYCLAYWEERQEPKLERYRGLTEDQLVLIGMDSTVEIIAHQSYQAPMPVPAPMALSMIQQGMMQAFPPITLHDLDVRRMKTYGCAKLEVLPPERCLVGADTKSVSVRDADFFEYWEYKTLSDLRADGFDVPDDIGDAGGMDKGLVDQSRDVTANTVFPENEQTVDPAMRKVKARMVWIRNDYNQDGIAELRYVVAVGKTMLVNEEVAAIPVATIVPYPMPHRHFGLSMYDVVADLQRIKSAMQRQVIDNQYLANNGRTAVDKNLVNLEDLQVSRPGGIVRTNGPPSQSIMPFVHPQTAQHAIGVLQYFDGILEDRGGVSKPFVGADVEAINAQPGTIAQLTSAASQKIEQLARILAEGVKELFLIVHELVLSNATVEEKVQLRNKWVTVDPRQWRKRMDMSLMVGLGVGNRQQHAAGIAALLGLQEKALGIGLTSPPKIYNALSEYVKALGFSTPKQFFDEPDPNQPYQPAPPPQAQVAQINAEADVMVQRMKNDASLTLQQVKDEAQSIRTYFETMVESYNRSQERFVRAVSEATERMQELRLSGLKPNEGTNKVLEQVRSLSDSVQTVSDEVKALKKPKKRKVKAPSGKTYEIEES